MNEVIMVVAYAVIIGALKVGLQAMGVGGDTAGIIAVAITAGIVIPSLS